MLCLTRNVEQSILIGDDIEVKVLSIDGKAVKIGITAPRSVPVWRNEIYKRILAERVTKALEEQGLAVG